MARLKSSSLLGVLTTAFCITPIGLAPAAASVVLPATAVIQATSPVSIIESVSFRNDSNSAIFACFGFRNDGQQPATAIKLRVFQVDSFGDVQISDEKSIDGQFAPGVVIKVKRALNGLPNDGEGRCLTSYLGVPATRALVVRVEKVLFSDGSVWTSPVFGQLDPRARDTSNTQRPVVPIAPYPTLAPS